MDENITLSRRTLIQGTAALTAASIGGALCLSRPDRALAEDVSSPAHKEMDGDQYGFMARLDRCTDCQECVRACRAAHDTPEDAPSRRKVTEYYVAREGTYYVSTSCMHCEKPSCADVCPAEAISKGAGGIVTVDPDRCIGCKYCYQACPFGVPHYTNEGMDKCDACLSAGVALGEMPYCVRACKFRALSYGKMSDLMASSSDDAERIECETGPSMLLY